MNANRGGGGSNRGKGRQSGGQHDGGRGRGRDMNRSNSDRRGSGSRDTASASFPPGLGHFVSSNNARSTQAQADGWGMPSTDGWGDAEDAQQSIPTRGQAVPDADQRARSYNDAGSHGSRNRRFSRDRPSPQRPQGQIPQNFERQDSDASSRHRNSGQRSSGRNSYGSSNVQGNVVPIPSRYFNTPDGPARLYSNEQQAAGQQRSGNSRLRHDNSTPGASQAAAPERTRHSAYWPQDILQKGFKKMELFRGVIRINAGDRSQAYISLPGLSADVFVRGLESQNRSVEGDEVALRILPPCGWWVFKREQLRAAQKAASTAAPSDIQGIDLGTRTDDPQLTEVATPAANGMENAASGGEVPYQFAEDEETKGEGSAASGLQALQPVDEDSVFEMSDINSSSTAPPHAATAQSQDLDQQRDSMLDDTSSQARESSANNEQEQDLDSTLDSASVLGVPESPIESSSMQAASGTTPSSQADSFSLSADLVRKLSLNQKQSEAGQEPPDSTLAVGSAPSTTLSDFSAVNAASDTGHRNRSSAQKSGGNKRNSYGSNRRRSVDNRDNGAPKDSAWHGADSVEAAVQILNDLMLKFPGMRPTAEVVAILKPSTRRQQVVGILKQEHDHDVLALWPAEPRMPRMMVNAASVPFELRQQLQAEAKDQSVGARTLVSGIMTTWAAGSVYPMADVRSALGQAGELEAETLALLEMEAVNSADFTPEVMACLPKEKPWIISQQDQSQRRDFTTTRLFSIDPPTARDLDDALSIQPLPGGNFRVGVHIADVAHFIKQGSALDEEAQARATSVYLVQRVIPMLPRLLCEELCSLNPGVERLSFSITWDLTPQGKILAQWAGRSIIKSCVKLAYGHAQEMIEGKFAGLQGQEPPGVELHGYQWSEVVGDVLALNGIARHLKAGRASNGALRLDNTKLYFQMDDNGNPVSAAPYVQREANQLVEEFMLLANMSVAKMIADAFPERALLRRHPPPDERKIGDLTQLANDLGLSLDVSTAGSIARSLQSLREGYTDKAVMEVVTLLATKPMKNAEYFSTGDFEDSTKWHHYALAVSHYTHFTSPIRRYPDVMVHRLLAAALRLNPSLTQLPPELLSDSPQPGPQLDMASHNPSISTADRTDDVSTAATQGNHTEVQSGSGLENAGPAAISGDDTNQATNGVSVSATNGVAKQADSRAVSGSGQQHKGRVAAVTAQHGLVDSDTVSAIATHCNQRKQAAKNVQDGSLRLYLCVLLRQHPIVTEAVCLQIGGNRFIDVYISELGMDRRIHIEHMQPSVTADFDKEHKLLSLARSQPTNSPFQLHQLNGQHPSLTGPSTQANSSDAISQAFAASANQDSNAANTSSTEDKAVASSGSSSVAVRLEDEACMQGIEFVQNLRNPSNLQPAFLPLQLKLFARVPVVVSARLFGQTGKPSETFAQLLVK